MTPPSSAKRTGRDHGRRTTIHDVAARAGVSVGTISNVLNNPGIVAPATRQRVQSVMDDLGFVRSTAASQLRRGRSRLVGVVVPDLTNPFFAEVVAGVENVLRTEGYMIMLCSTGAEVEREREYLVLLEQHRVEGLLITPASKDLVAIEQLAMRQVPTVLLDRSSGSHAMCSVTVDDFKGGRLAAAHLADQGFHRVVFVNGPHSIPQCAERARGAKRELAAPRWRKSVALEELTIPALGPEQGEAAAAQIASAGPRPFGVMCANDAVALGVLKGLTQMGLKVPHDVALVGYDDVAFASSLLPALTSVRQPKAELGRAAAELFLAELRDNRHRHHRRRFEPELVIRASTVS